MKRYFLYSLLFHILLLVLAFFVIRNHKAVKAPEPLIATMVTPEELKEKKQEQKQEQKREKVQEEPFRMPRLPKNLPAPEKKSAVPTSPSAKARVTAPAKSIAPSDAGRSHARMPEPNNGQRGSSIEPGSNEPGPSQELQKHPSFPAFGTTHDKLFDKDIIARATPGQGEEQKKDNGITFDTKEYKYYGYMQRLREKIEGIWKYPAEAAERRLNGEVYIRFTIRKDGRLGAVELVHTSGYKTLDDAAIKALRDADPYWPLPDSWNEDSFTITGRFIYYLSGTYIR